MHRPVPSLWSIVIASLLVGLLVLPGIEHSAAGTDQFDEPTAALLVAAVEAAFELDLYNDHCRSDHSGRNTDNLNKLLASKLRVTVLGVLDDLFPEDSYRRSQARMQTDFLARLQAGGGCAGAKTEGLRAQLGERYSTAMTAIGKLP